MRERGCPRGWGPSALQGGGPNCPAHKEGRLRQREGGQRGRPFSSWSKQPHLDTWPRCLPSEQPPYDSDGLCSAPDTSAHMNHLLP